MGKFTNGNIQNRIRKLRAEPPIMVTFNVVILLVGLHSLLLGFFIYFFTDLFYKLFFGSGLVNVFFVRQSGLFLVLSGFFYLCLLLDIRKFYFLIQFIIWSKIAAALFLLTNARLTSAPGSIYAAAAADGLMAVVLASLYVRCKKGELFNLDRG